jgi:hypothetical protein
LQEEVFNYLFVRKKTSEENGGVKDDQTFYVYCQSCAIKSSPSLADYRVLYQYELQELCDTYDKFLMYQVIHNIHLHCRQQSRPNTRGWELAERSERRASIPKITGSNSSSGSELTFHPDLLLTASLPL